MNLQSSNSGIELPIVAPTLPPSNSLPAQNLGAVSSTGPIPVAPPIIMPAAHSSQSQANQSTEHDTDDAPNTKDLMDKKWINKIKSIILKTRDNPYQQSEQLAQLKVEYMAKQFNKTVKSNT